MRDTIGGGGAPPPEGTATSSASTFTPEEREEFEAWNRASDKALELVEQLARGEPEGTG
jgi:hypothetical protein